MKHVQLKDGGNASIERHRSGWRLTGHTVDGRWMDVMTTSREYLRSRVHPDSLRTMPWLDRQYR